MTDKRKVHDEKLEARWQEWNAQIARFKNKTEKAKAEMEVDGRPPLNFPDR